MKGQPIAKLYSKVYPLGKKVTASMMRPPRAGASGQFSNQSQRTVCVKEGIGVGRRVKSLHWKQLETF